MSKRRESTCTYVQVPKVVRKVDENLDEIISEANRNDGSESSINLETEKNLNTGTGAGATKKDGFSLQRAWCCLTGRRTS